MTDDKNKTPNLSEINKSINTSLWLLGGVAFAVFGFYIWKFHKLDFTDNPAELGPFGDYIGGLLNPCIALFALYWLTSSIKTQIKELTETREQFEKISQNQLEQTSLQNFESLFFQLLETKDKAIKDILCKNIDDIKNISINYDIAKLNMDNMNIFYSDNSARKDGSEYKEKILNDIEKEKPIGKEAIRKNIIIFKTLSRYHWEEFYTQLLLDYMGNYFRICYQIVKLIDENELLSQNADDKENKNKDKKTELQKKYFDIFRATLTQYELEAFFFNCLSEYGNKKFKKFIEDYGLFEPLLIDTDKDFEEMHRLTRYAYMYDKNSFENNEMFKQYFDDIEKLKNINFKKLRDEIYLMCMSEIIITSNESFFNKFDLISKNHFVDNFDKSIFRYKFGSNSKRYLDNVEDFWKNRVNHYQIQIDDFNHKIQIVSQNKDYIEDVKEWGEQINVISELIELAKNICYTQEIGIIIDYKINISEFFDYHQLNKI